MAQGRNSQDKKPGTNAPQHPASVRRDERPQVVHRKTEEERVNQPRSFRSARERDNDLYERQSM